MAKDMSKQTEQSQNEEVNTDSKQQEPSYKDVVAALEAGDAAEIDRLMAVDDGSEEQEEENKEEEDTTTVDDKDDGSQVDDDPETNETGAADDAAPSAKPTAEDELRQELHRLKSELGRLPNLQSEIAALKKELRAGPARAAKDTPASETQTKEPELSDGLKTKIAQLRAIDPDLADILETMHKESVTKAQTSTEDVRHELLELQQHEEDMRHFAEQKALLSQMVPEHEQVFALPQWKQWKETLTPGFRAMAESPYATEVAQAINAFGYYLQSTGQVSSQSKPSTSSGGGDPNVNTNVGAAGSQVAESRTRKISAAAEVKNPSAKVAPAFDERAALSEVYNQLGKELGMFK